jgi:hemolysin activation/secretion protein
VAVVTQDVWTLNPGVSFGRSGGENSGGIEIEELNLLGRGTALSLGLTSNVDRDSTTFHYADSQIGRSWWSTSVQYADNSDGRRTDASLDHPFYALDTRQAGGVFLLDDDRLESRYDLGEVTEKYRKRQLRATGYAGRSAGLVDASAMRWTAGFTYDDNRFDRADDPLATDDVPPDRRLAYPWIGIDWLQDDFRTARNRDLIERTEDVALGWRASARLGFADSAFGADRTAAIFDARLSRGHEPSRRDTWLYAGSLNGRYEHGELTNTVLSGSARYYRRQSPRRVLFASVAFDASKNLDADRQLLLGGDNGLRGYPLRYQAGEGRWLATIEQRGFTNWFPFRLFNVGGAAFADIGGTWGDNPFGSESQGVLKDVGVGLRLGNARSALGNVLHIDLAFPLDGDPSIDSLQIVIETKQTF